MKRAFYVLCLTLSPPALVAAAPAAQDPAPAPEAGAWSAALLRQVWSEPAAVPNSAAQTPSEGLSLRSYQLRHLKVGEAGRTQNLVSLLQKILPAGSSLKPDLPANSLHVLTTPTAHTAIWDLLSTLDRADPQAAPAAIPEEVQAALAKLSATPAASEAILSQLRELRTRVDSQMGQHASPTSSLGALPLLLSSVALCGLAWLSLRLWWRKKAAPSASASPGDGNLSAALVLSPEKISAALAPLQHQWQQEVMGSLNQAAIRLESWYQEQKRQKESLEQLAERQQTALVAAQNALADSRSRWMADTQALVSQASGRFESVAERLEAQTQQLNLQNDRVESLAQELAQTVGELDRTKDEILRLEAIITDKNAALDASRVEIEARERLLIHEQARLSALSLLLEEGEGPEAPRTAAAESAEWANAVVDSEPSANMPSPNGHTPNGATRAFANTPASQTALAPCPTTTPILPPHRFQFLPPDLPET